MENILPQSTSNPLDPTNPSGILGGTSPLRSASNSPISRRSQSSTREEVSALSAKLNNVVSAQETTTAEMRDLKSVMSALVQQLQALQANLPAPPIASSTTSISALPAAPTIAPTVPTTAVENPVRNQPPPPSTPIPLLLLSAESTPKEVMSWTAAKRALKAQRLSSET